VKLSFVGFILVYIIAIKIEFYYMYLLKY